MGTRNLMCVVSNGEIKVANYCQWDGYPTGQGNDIVKFIIDHMEFEKFQREINKLTFISNKELKNLWAECGANPESDFVSFDVSDKFKVQYPHLHRDCGAEILHLIQEGFVESTIDSISFAADSLFCEWAYVIDLDNKVLEVYRGFNKEPLIGKERFKFLKKEEDDYYPVKLLTKFKFEELTYQTMKNLEEKLYME